jgi:hypothetical protein
VAAIRIKRQQNSKVKNTSNRRFKQMQTQGHGWHETYLAIHSLASALWMKDLDG